MAIFKIQNDFGKSEESLRDVFERVLLNDAVDPSLTWINVFHDYDEVTPENAIKVFMKLKNVYRKTGGRQYIHATLYFGKDEQLDNFALSEIAFEVGYNAFKGHQFCSVVHKYNDGIQLHYIVNSVSLISGNKWHTTPKDLGILRSKINRTIKKLGYPITVEGPNSDNGQA